MESLDENPSIIMQGRTAREERSRRDAGGRQGGSGVKKTVSSVAPAADEVKSDEIKKTDDDVSSVAPAADEVKSDKTLTENVERDVDKPAVASTVNEEEADKVSTETAQENVE